MKPDFPSKSELHGLALPLAVLALAAWNAVPPLIGAWRDDLYARGALPAFGIWLAVPVWLFFRKRPFAVHPCFFWLVLALLFSMAGSMTGLRVLHHLSLTVAVPGLVGLRIGGIATALAALAWLPVTGWLLSHYIAGGLAGWERPLYASIMGLLFFGFTRMVARPKYPITFPPA